MLARMGWQPDQAVSTQLVLPELRWNRAGRGSNPAVTRHVAQATRFRRATQAAGERAAGQTVKTSAKST
jgi:hypothetical protein